METKEMEHMINIGLLVNIIYMSIYNTYVFSTKPNLTVISYYRFSKLVQLRETKNGTYYLVNKLHFFMKFAKICYCLYLNIDRV